MAPAFADYVCGTGIALVAGSMAAMLRCSVEALLLFSGAAGDSSPDPS
jgi:hypothetical protein